MDGSTQVFFVFDRTFLQKEEDDLKDAFICFYPSATKNNEQILLYGQLMGLVGFFESFAGSAPKMYTLSDIKFAVMRRGHYNLCLSGALTLPDMLLTSQLERLYSIYQFYQGSFEMLRKLSENNTAKFLACQDLVWSSYVPFVTAYGNVPAGTFGAVPVVTVPKGHGSVFLQASGLLQQLAALPGVRAGCILYKRAVLCTQLRRDITYKLLLLRPHQKHLPCLQIETDLELPSSVRLLSVYLSKDEYSSFVQPTNETLAAANRDTADLSSKTAHSRTVQSLSATKLKFSGDSYSVLDFEQRLPNSEISEPDFSPPLNSSDDVVRSRGNSFTTGFLDSVGSDGSQGRKLKARDEFDYFGTPDGKQMLERREGEDGGGSLSLANRHERKISTVSMTSDSDFAVAEDFDEGELGQYRFDEDDSDHWEDVDAKIEDPSETETSEKPIEVGSSQEPSPDSSSESEEAANGDCEEKGGGSTDAELNTAVPENVKATDTKALSREGIAEGNERSEFVQKQDKSDEFSSSENRLEESEAAPETEVLAATSALGQDSSLDLNARFHANEGEAGPLTISDSPDLGYNECDDKEKDESLDFSLKESDRASSELKDIIDSILTDNEPYLAEPATEEDLFKDHQPAESRLSTALKSLSLEETEAESGAHHVDVTSGLAYGVDLRPTPDSGYKEDARQRVSADSAASMRNSAGSAASLRALADSAAIVRSSAGSAASVRNSAGSVASLRASAGSAASFTSSNQVCLSVKGEKFCMPVDSFVSQTRNEAPSGAGLSVSSVPDSKGRLSSAVPSDVAGGHQNMTLYVQGHSDIVLLLLMDSLPPQDVSLVSDVWAPAFSQLAELEGDLSQLDLSPSLGPQAEASLDLTYDAVFGSINGNTLNPASGVEHSFISSAAQIYGELQADPTLHQVVARAHNGCIAGRREGDISTFHAPLSSVLASLPTAPSPRDPFNTCARV